MEQRQKNLLHKKLAMKPFFWGGDGAESTEELDWETHTEGEI